MRYINKLFTGFKGSSNGLHMNFWTYVSGDIRSIDGGMVYGWSDGWYRNVRLVHSYVY